MTDRIEHIKRSVNFTEHEFCILIGLFYCVPFLYFDDGSEENNQISEDLGRKSGSVDMQARNIKGLITWTLNATAEKKTGVILKKLIEETRNDPIQAIKHGRFEAGKYTRISQLYDAACKNLGDLYTENDLSLTSVNLEQFAVLARVVWVTPKIALSAYEFDEEERKRVVAALGIDSVDVADEIFKAVYGLVNRCFCKRGEKYYSAYQRYKSVLDLDAKALLKFVIDTCEKRRWHVFTRIFD